MWKSLKEWKQLTEEWTETKFNDINVQEIKQKGDHYNKIVTRCSKNMPSNPVLEELKSFIYEFKETMPVVVALRNKDLQELHWKEMVKIIFLTVCVFTFLCVFKRQKSTFLYTYFSVHIIKKIKHI